MLNDVLGTHQIITDLIPIKEHSERVPNKKMRSFFGWPLFHLVAETLEAYDYIDSIIINTDNDLIAADAQNTLI